MTSPAPQPAGLLRRLAAIVYDGLLLAGLLMLASTLWLPVTGGDALQRGTPLFLLHQLYLLLVCFAFFAWFWTHGGQTLGMRTWRLRVSQPGGEPITLTQAVKRFAAASLSWLPAGLGFLWSLVDGERRTWHDIASGTVLRHEPRPKRDTR